jgi:hypothetical protein
MPLLVRRLLLIFAASAIAVGLVLSVLHWAARQSPRFYEQSLARRPTDEGAGAERLEQQALALHNQLHHEGRFEVRFTEDEINGWLADELPQKFPRLLNSSLSQPRVAIEEGKLRLAVRYRTTSVDTVLSFAAEARLTGKPNELAIRVSQVRAGLVPVPLGSWLEDIQQRAARAGLSLKWSEEAGDPVALVRVPGEIETDENDQPEDDEPHRFVLEDVRLEPGVLVVVGHTELPIVEPGHRHPPVDTAGQPVESSIQQR